MLALTLFFCFGFCGCSPFKQKSQALNGNGGILRPAEIVSDTVSIEIFTIRAAPQQQAQIQQLWREVDEQRLPPDLRRQLIDSGLRVGFLGNALTPTLSQLISITGKQPQQEANPLGNLQEVSVTEILKQPSATRQFRNLLPNMQAHIQTFDQPIPEYSILEWEQGCLSGRTYSDAVGLIALSCIGDGKSVRFTLTPEIEYGTAEQRVVVRQGLYVPENGRPRRKFAHLTMTQDLLPGQWIILGTASENVSGIGRAFFVRGIENSEQRVIAIRLISVSKPEKKENGTLQPLQRLGERF